LKTVDFIMVLSLLFVTALALLSELVYMVFKDQIGLHFEAMLLINQELCNVFEIALKFDA